MSLMAARRMTAESRVALRRDLVSIMKGVSNKEEAIGSLAVARQLHQDYTGKSRSTGRETRRVRHAWAF